MDHFDQIRNEQLKKLCDDNIFEIKNFLEKCNKCNRYIHEHCAYYPKCEITGACILLLKKCSDCKKNVCATCENFCPMCCHVYCNVCNKKHKNKFIHYKSRLDTGCVICYKCKDKDPIALGIPVCKDCNKIMYGCCDPWWCSNPIEKICYDCSNKNQHGQYICFNCKEPYWGDTYGRCDDCNY